ncbi:MAG: TIGR03564 family F420-dependent LLM class oxidoreductase [Acidimicrobiia bacterium]|nr:TIGR03564 family F420-dependent LLM class oxidoreductase [Acidimicrobiia bacterium]
MRIGMWIEPGSAGRFETDLQAAADAGFGSAWTPQIFGPDALTMIAAVARDVPEIRVGTAVVPVWLRHPTMLAAQALTVQQIIGERFVLGIGLAHQLVVEGMYGIPFERPAQYMEEYLSVLTPLLEAGSVSFAGERFTVNGTVSVHAPAPPVIVAALGPKMLETAGRLAAGTVTWMTGVETIRNHTVPTIRAAAEAAGRAEPEVVVGLPVSVTDDVDASRAVCAQEFAVYGSLPSYRAMLDREGAAGPADVGLIGDESAVDAAIDALAASGATELIAVVYDPATRDRTLDLLRRRL